MAVNTIASGHYQTNYHAQQIRKNTASGSFSGQLENIAGAQKKEEPAEEIRRESTSDTEIITKPDGSRVLLITTRVGGMETVMSIALSQPAPLMGNFQKISDRGEHHYRDKSDFAGCAKI